MKIISTLLKSLINVLTLVLLFESQTIMAADKRTVRIVYSDNSVKVVNKIKKVSIITNGAKVSVDNTLADKEVEFILEGKSDNGSFEYNGSYKTTIVLNGVNLKTTEGAVINLNSGKRMKIKMAKGTINSLEDGVDTLHKACIYTKGHLEISGNGTLKLNGHAKNVISAKEYILLDKSTGRINITTDAGNAISTDAQLTINGGNININMASVGKKALRSDSLMTINGGQINAVITGDGSKGIKCLDDLVINDGTVNIVTSSNYLTENSGMDGFGGGPDMGGFGGREINDSTWQPMPMMEDGQEMMEKFQQMPQEERDSVMKAMGMGGPMHGFGMGSSSNIELSDSIHTLLLGAEQKEDKNNGIGGPGGRRNLKGTAKAVKVMNKITINGGDIHLETSTAGSEGLEGKYGITVNGGKLYIKAQDDAVNSGGKIIFNGGDVFVWSIGNDAIDSNSREAGALTLSGGKVMSCSQCGPPDEAFDCDSSPMLLTGGIIFGMGGSMGGEPTTPTAQDNTQPTVSLNGLPCPKGKTLLCLDETDKEIFSFVFPFTMESSNSILSLPEFNIGKTYTVKIKDPDVKIKEFTFDSVISK